VLRDNPVEPIIEEKSPPEQKARSPSPVITMQAIDGSERVERTAAVISSSVSSRQALSVCGRSMVIQAIWSTTSKMMSL
jgi:hypothetical protein